MVRIRKKELGNHIYYYLEHSIRSGKNIEKKEKYLGKELPKNIDALKEEFLKEVLREKWYPALDEIRAVHSKEQRNMPKSAREKELRNFSIKFTYDSNRIEGSTLTLRETAELLEKGISPKRPLEDVKETEAHEKVFYEMMDYGKDLSRQIILYWHDRLFKETKGDIAGKIRQHQVMISGSKFTPPLPAEIEPLLRDFFSWYAREKDRMHPVELAALVHLKFVTIHPFADGNGRISRLMMNFVLNKRCCPMLDIHYENRDSYYNALEKAQIKELDTPFINWLFSRYAKDLKRYSKKHV